jgi:hypothetical protein
MTCWKVQAKEYGVHLYWTLRTVEERERQMKIDKKEALRPRDSDFFDNGKPRPRAERRNQRRKDKYAELERRNAGLINCLHLYAAN